MSYVATHEQRSEAAKCLIDLAVLSRETHSALLHNEPAGVIAQIQSRPLNQAARLSVLHSAVAIDHLVAYASLLKVSASHGDSLVAIERSFVETWARAWWLMDVGTATRAEWRARAMVVAELETAKRRGIAMLSDEPIEAAIERAIHERDEIQVLTFEAVPGPTKLVTDLLEQISTVEQAKAIYSHLSGVAHGESIFTVSITEGPDAYWKVALPSDNLNKYCTALHGVSVVGMSRLMTAWNLPLEVQQRFSEESIEIFHRLAEVLPRN